MKNLVGIFLVALFSLLNSSLSYAETDNKSLWTCKTNASSANSGSTEEKADTDMEKNGKSLAKALAFAAQHCRDCTKITCSKE